MMGRFLLFLVLVPVMIFAQAGSYYDAISTASGSFIEDLKGRVRNPYTRISYDSFDETNVANFASYANPDGTRSVVCALSGYVYTYTGKFTWGTMSREHTWCQSWMPVGGSSSNEYSDQHHLFPTHQNNANGRRSNHPLGNVSTVSYQFLGGKLGKNSKGETVYEVRDEHKGDAARALLYMSVRYDGAAGNWTFNNLNSRLPGMDEAPQDVNTLLEWHRQDPPDRWEVERNDYIQSIQRNRNPFVDKPEYVNYIDFGSLTKVNAVLAAEPSNYATSIAANGAGNSITLSWTDAAAGGQAPGGYLITVYEDDGYFIPADGTVYGNDFDLSDGKGRVNVSYAAGNSFTFDSLKEEQGYYFRVYSYNGSGSGINYKTDGTVPGAAGSTDASTQTFVMFAAENGRSGESGVFNIGVKIVNAAAAATSAQVVLKSGSSGDLNGFTAATVSWAGGESGVKTVPVTITEDSEAEGDEVFVFGIESVSGGDQAEAGEPALFSMTVEDDDATMIYFAAAEAEVSEGDGVYELRVKIKNAAAGTAAEADVVLAAGDGADLGGFTTVPVRFAAGSSEDAVIAIGITDDDLREGKEMFELALENVRGGNGAMAAEPAVLSMTVLDNDMGAGRVIISEAADHTTFSREYVEIYNAGGEAVNLENWVLKERYGLTATTRSLKLSTATQRNSAGSGYMELEPGEFAIIMRDADNIGAFKSEYGMGNDAAVFAVYPYSSGTSVPQMNGDEGYQLENAAGVMIDRFGRWDLTGSGDFRLTPQTSYQRLAAGGNSGEEAGDWAATASGSYSFTPGSNNDIPVPVELVSFKAAAAGMTVELEWQTATEVNSMGFYVERDGGSGWQEVGFVKGAGSSSAGSIYYFKDQVHKEGRYAYRLRMTDLDGSYEYSGVVEAEAAAPVSYGLEQNYPNPFNPVTVIGYSVPEAGQVSLRLFNMLGEEAAVLVGEFKEAGRHTVEFDGSGLRSGVYFYTLVSGGYVETRKLVLLK